MNPLEKVKNFLSSFLGGESYQFGTPPEKKTGPGFTEPMGHPVPNKGKREVVKTALAATPQPSTAPDLFAGYNKARGLPADDIAKIIVSSARKHKIDPSLLAAVLFNESGFNPKAVNQNTPGNVDRGIAQINSTAFPNVTDEQAYDPNFAVDFAGRLMRQNIDYFGGDISRGIAAYNVGRGGAGVRGPAPFGGGPTGQGYLDRVSLNLTPDFAQSLGIKFTEGIFDQ